MDVDFVVRAARFSALLCLLLSLLGLGSFVLARVRAVMHSASSSMHQNHSSCSTLTLIEQRNSFAMFLSFSVELMELQHHTNIRGDSHRQRGRVRPLNTPKQHVTRQVTPLTDCQLHD